MNSQLHLTKTQLKDYYSLNDSDLLELYTEVVKTDHYDPFVTPKLVAKARALGIDQDQLKNEILRRMSLEGSV